MRLLLAKEVRGYIGTQLIPSLELINKTVPTSMKVVRDKVADNRYDWYLEFEEFDGTNCVVLFDMWYDLESRVFSVSRADSVTGVKLFTIEELFSALGVSVPRDISDRVLEYKATGKMDVLFSAEAEGPKTFLSFYLEQEKPKKTNDQILKTLEKLINAIDDLESSIKHAVRNGNERQAQNIFSTITSYSRISYEEFNEKELYASSCRRNKSASDNMSEIKALQAYEIAEAEAQRQSDGYLDPVVLDVEKTPTFQRITSREKNSIKTSVERNIMARTFLDSEEVVNKPKELMDIRKFFVEISKCAGKVLGV